MISMDKQYRTRDGRGVRVLCVDRDGVAPVIGLIQRKKGGEDCTSWIQDGKHVQGLGLDLIEIKPPVVFWVNVYDGVGASPGNVIWFLDEDTAKHQGADDMTVPIIIARRVELPISEDEE